METKLHIIIMPSSAGKVYKKCLEEHKPTKRATRPSELADEENYPSRYRPPYKPLLVRLASLLDNHLIYIFTQSPQITQLGETPMAEKNSDACRLTNFCLV